MQGRGRRKKAIREFEGAWEENDAYALIMLDISMPDLSGPDVLARILSYERTRRIPESLIRVSNSALYRGVEESRSVEQATGRLGTVTERIVASIGHRALFVQKKKRYAPLLERLWRHSLATGHACDRIAAEAAPQIQDEAFTMGLLHDVGWLLLIQVLSALELKKRMQSRSDHGNLPVALLEAHHGDFGARIFEKM